MIGADIKVFGKADLIKKNLLSLNPQERIRLYVENVMHVNPYDANEPPIPMKELVSILTYGSYEIPARPFFSDFLREEHEQISRLLKAGIHLRGKVGRQKKDRIYINYEDVADSILHAFRYWLMEGSYYRSVCPNGESTITRKGGDTPLVDTGQLLAAISVKVVYKPKKVSIV